MSQFRTATLDGWSNAPAGTMPTSVEDSHRALDALRARVTARAAGQAERIISAMDQFDPVPMREQKAHYLRHGAWGPNHRPYSAWEMSRVVFPRMLAELDALHEDRAVAA